MLTARVKRLLPLVLVLGLVAGCGSAHSHGCEIVLRAVPLHGGPVTQAGMKLVRDILANRVDTLGVASAQVTVRGDEIVIDVPGTHAPKALGGVVSVTGNLQFFDFEKDLAPPTVKNGNPTPYPSLYSLLSAVDGARRGTPEAYYLFDGSTAHRVLQGPAGTTRALLEPYGGKQPAGSSILAVPPSTEVVSGPVETPSTRPVGRSADGTYWYLLNLPPAISGHDLEESEVQAQSDPTIGSPEVVLGFTKHGAQEFQAITKAEYERGLRLSGLHAAGGTLNERFAQHNAIVLDGRLVSTPFIDYTDPTLQDGITGGAAIINNVGSMQAANNLALVLQTGSLPYRLVHVSAGASCAP